jgi:5-methylcytosine-specific restriction enzyme A
MMYSQPKRKLLTLKPRLQELPQRVPPLKTPRKTLKQKAEANGRTLALDGAAWRKLRAQVLSVQPLCLECRDQGVLVPATEVDHIDNDPSNNALDNLQGLCRAHHSAKTHRDMGHRVHMGCDVNGMPTDPAHPWNQIQKSPRTA